MKKLVVLTSVFLFTVTISCKENQKKTEQVTDAPTEKPLEEKKETPKHWSYDGETSPEHWAEIEKESACGGNHQSPIDIVTDNLVTKSSGVKVSDIHYDFNTIIHDITNNGHSVQYNFADNVNYVSFEGKRYNLAQYHFHAASEHSVNGMHFPLVIHMVHVSEDKKFVVFALMVKEGNANDAFDFIESYLPVNQGETKAIGKAHHFENSFLENFDHYYYKGSLTTPPCTEAVNWFVFKDAIEASPTQVKAIADLMPRNNYRPTQPLNGRTVYISE
jgi:carbonic anhydrase